MSRLHRQKIKQRRHDHNQVDTTHESADVSRVAPATLSDLHGLQSLVPDRPAGLHMPEVDEARKEGFDEGFAAGAAAEAAKKIAKKTGARAKRSSSTRR